MWRNAKKRLPVEGKEVLVYTVDDQIKTGAWHKNKERYGRHYWLADYGTNDDINGLVMYWRPMPKAPR